MAPSCVVTVYIYLSIGACLIGPQLWNGAVACGGNLTPPVNVTINDLPQLVGGTPNVNVVRARAVNSLQFLATMYLDKVNRHYMGVIVHVHHASFVVILYPQTLPYVTEIRSKSSSMYHQASVLTEQAATGRRVDPRHHPHSPSHLLCCPLVAKVSCTEKPRIQ